MTFTQKQEQNQFGSLPVPGKVKVAVEGKELLCDFAGEVIVLGDAASERRFKVLSDTFEKGYRWVARSEISQAE